MDILKPDNIKRRGHLPSAAHLSGRRDHRCQCEITEMRQELLSIVRLHSTVPVYSYCLHPREEKAAVYRLAAGGDIPGKFGGYMGGGREGVSLLFPDCFFIGSKQPSI